MEADQIRWDYDLNDSHRRTDPVLLYGSKIQGILDSLCLPGYSWRRHLFIDEGRLEMVSAGKS